MHTMFSDDVFLKEDTHQYFNHKTGEEYRSVGSLNKELGEEFDEMTISKFSAKKRGVSQEEILKEWKDKRDTSNAHGTRIHNAIEYYFKTGQIHSADEEIRGPILSIVRSYSDYYQNHSEVCLYDHAKKIAGTTDKICLLGNKRNGWADISDFKTNMAHGIEYVGYKNKTLLAPFDYLQDCNYIKYSFQLSWYAFLFERLSGYRVRKMFIHFIPPLDLLQHQIIPVIYLKKEVEYLYNRIEAVVPETEVPLLDIPEGPAF